MFSENTKTKKSGFVYFLLFLLRFFKNYSQKTLTKHSVLMLENKNNVLKNKIK